MDNERNRFATITLKGGKTTCEEKFYFRENADAGENEFETGSMTNANLLNARNAYRIKHGLLTSDEIAAILRLMATVQEDFLYDSDLSQLKMQLYGCKQDFFCQIRTIFLSDTVTKLIFMQEP